MPELKALLERHGLKPTKRWGQHFLISEKVVSAICAAVPDTVQGILEVGPGPGVLTSVLSERSKLIAVEIDDVAVSALGESSPKATVIAGDALRMDLAELLMQTPKPRMIVSNMPYNITGPLLTAFTMVRHHLDGCVLMMQKEVAQRIMAKPGERELGSLSVMLQSRFVIDRVIEAPSSAFFPPPKVDSTVLKFTPRETGWESDFDAVHERVVRQAFTQPRKTLANNLKQVGFDPSSMGWASTIRPHQIAIADWETLVRRLYDPK
ncbi:MAG: ribosomal RNA small subunit methyltransferase A [Chthonomonas sp.]|nr:ribosomal RNA small subunit methyltransferase A [Chthonomonas sp.]